MHFGCTFLNDFKIRALIFELNDFIYCKLLAHQSYRETVEYDFNSFQLKDTACKCYKRLMVKSNYRSCLQPNMLCSVV